MRWCDMDNYDRDAWIARTIRSKCRWGVIWRKLSGHMVSVETTMWDLGSDMGGWATYEEASANRMHFCRGRSNECDIGRAFPLDFSPSTEAGDDYQVLEWGKGAFPPGTPLGARFERILSKYNPQGGSYTPGCWSEALHETLVGL